MTGGGFRPLLEAVSLRKLLAETVHLEKAGLVDGGCAAAGLWREKAVAAGRHQLTLPRMAPDEADALHLS